GRQTVQAFLRAGHSVTAVLRPASRPGGFEESSRLRIVRADLRRPPPDFGRALEGVEALIHLAAAISGSEEAQFHAGVVATERLRDVVAPTPIRRLVLCSSLSVYDWSAVRGGLDERSPLEARPYDRDGYAIAKVWQERVVRRWCESRGCDLTVLRPGY